MVARPGRFGHRACRETSTRRFNLDDFEIVVRRMRWAVETSNMALQALARLLPVLEKHDHILPGLSEAIHASLLRLESEPDFLPEDVARWRAMREQLGRESE
jgi:hypothetical protein